MAIKIPFVSDISQIVRDMRGLGDRLDTTVDDLEEVERAGEQAADGLEGVAEAGRDLDRIDAGDTARDLDKVADSSESAARSLDDVTDAGKGLDRVGDAGKDAADGLDQIDGASDAASRSLDKVESSLEQLGDAGGDAGKELRGVEDDVERMAKGVESEVESMDDKVRAAFRNMADHARQNTGRVADTSRRDFDRAGDATETFRDEARQNLSETLSSFDGSLEGMVDGLQGTLGGVVGDLGPAGMIGAGAIAAGIGVGMAYADKVAEGINEKGDMTAALVEQLRAAGGAIDDVDFDERMDEWGAAIQDTREVWEVWQDSAKTGFEQISELSRDAGMEMEDMMKGVAGPAEDAEQSLALVRERIKEIRESDYLDIEQLKALEELEKQMEDNLEVQERAIENEKLRADVIGVTTESLLEQVDAQEELTGVLTSAEEAELDYLDTLAKTTETLEENGRTVDKNTEKGRENRRALIDLRDSIFDYAAAELEAGESTSSVTADLGEQRKAFIRSAEAAGYTTEQAESLADAYGLIPEDIVTDVGARGVSDTKRQLNSIDRDINTTVHVRESGVGSAKNRIRWAFTTMRVNVRVHPQIPTASIW